jgi:succinate dehydrogenase / fumarate reductase cytochrome b subunit
MSPHLTIWRWGPHMLVSILHRITGGALSVVGLALLVWWLAAIGNGPDAYSKFTSFLGLKLVGIPVVLVALAGLTWAFFQHTLSGVRHLVMDSGAGFEIQTNKKWAVATVVGAILLTLAVWLPLIGGML